MLAADGQAIAPWGEVVSAAGAGEPWFLANARRRADALRDVGADVVMEVREGSHGDAFWRNELPLMIAWALGR